MWKSYKTEVMPLWKGKITGVHMSIVTTILDHNKTWIYWTITKHEPQIEVPKDRNTKPEYYVPPFDNEDCYFVCIKNRLDYRK